VAFASDAGPKYYLIDTEGRLGRGAGAVFKVPAGAIAPEETRYVAEDLPAFIRWMGTVA
jgi:hypothetical protein